MEKTTLYLVKTPKRVVTCFSSLDEAHVFISKHRERRYSIQSLIVNHSI